MNTPILKRFVFILAFGGYWASLAQTPDLVVGLHQPQPRIIVGAERMDTLFPMLKQKQIGLVVNHSSLVGNRHLADTLFDQGVCLRRIFAPEHGFRGEADAGEKVKDAKDQRTGVPIISLYGKRMKPNADDLEGLDAVVFDIQDVGARFYTYISTLYYVMEACAEQGKELIVLDRPNPNGHYVDGPVLNMQQHSFIGIAPLPIVHGCTIGELALLFKHENWIHKGYELKLRVIPCGQYSHDRYYELAVRPSPNLPNMRAVLLYPSLCFFEGTAFSLGRGTDFPFQVLGHPEYQGDTFSFVPRPNAGNKKPFLEGWVCKGIDFTKVPVDRIFKEKQINLRYLLEVYAGFSDKKKFFLENNFFNLLAGNKTLKQQIMAGKSEAEIRGSWQEDLEAFKAIRLKYLLYP